MNAMLEKILYFLICAFSIAMILFSYLAYKERSEYKASISDKRPLQKGIFLPPALFANAHLLLNKLRFAA